MCGIVGYVGERSCRELLMHGLERLEYRGYDSAGLSLLGEGEIESVRSVGNLSRLREAVEANDASSNGGGTALATNDRRGHHRHRSHPLGDARQALRAQRASAPGLHRAGSTSSSTGSSRTTSSCASSSRPRDTTSPPRPTPRLSRT